jgi:hypothetical protein
MQKHLMTPLARQPDALGSSRSHDHSPGRVNLPTGTQHFSPAAARALFRRELDYYRADVTYLSVEKAAERCLKLSALLTAAVAVDNAATRTLH